MKTLNEKVMLVTGASKGIGAAIAKDAAKAGAKVIVNYSSNPDLAAEVVKEIKALGSDAIAVKADVSKAGEVKSMFDTAIEHFGKIDILVNNAGIMLLKPLKDTTDEEYDRQFDVNVRGTFNTLREAATRLADNGSIINFSTTVNRVLQPTYSTYVAAKSAVEQLTRVFAKEIGSRGINVNSVSPGPTNTDLFIIGKPQEVIDRMISMNAFGRLAEPEDISKVVVFLASDAAKWITAQNLGVNGGMA